MLCMVGGVLGGRWVRWWMGGRVDQSHMRNIQRSVNLYDKIWEYFVNQWFNFEHIIQCIKRVKEGFKHLFPGNKKDSTPKLQTPNLGKMLGNMIGILLDYIQNSALLIEHLPIIVYRVP